MEFLRFDVGKQGTGFFWLHCTSFPFGVCGVDDTRCCVECEMRLMVCDGTYQSRKEEVGTLSLLTGYQTGPNANKHTYEQVELGSPL